MYPRSMVVIIQDCLNTIYVTEKQLAGADYQSKLAIQELQRNWPMTIGDIALQPMDWDAQLAYGFKSRLAMLSYMMLIRLVDNFHNCTWGVPMDITVFEMSIPIYGDQVNAVTRIARETCWCNVLDTTFFWRLIRPFCVTHPGKNIIDWFHYGDPSWDADYCCRLSGYWDEFLKKTIYWTVSSRVLHSRRLRWSAPGLKMDWLGNLIDALGLMSEFKRGVGPPSGIESRLALRDDIATCIPLLGTRW
eukprot:1372161-Alexandrium_andersonii.AAC.1